MDKKIPLFCDLGKVDYLASLEIQKTLHKKCVNGELYGVILKLEHNEVITLGKNSGLKDLKYSEEYYKNHNIPVIKTNRGGSATAHMPGQMVLYFILNIMEIGFFPKQFVCTIEDSVIKSLLAFNVKAIKDEKYPGIWIGQNKICAIGLRFEDRVSMHGIALNVDNSLKLFNEIVPCGIKGKGVTNLKNELSHNINIAEALVPLKAALHKAFGGLRDVLPSEILNS